MSFFPQTRTNDALLPDELPRFSQIGAGGGAPSFLHGGYQATTVAFGVLAFVHYINVIPSTVEANNQTPFSNACTLSRETINVVSNSMDENTTVRTRINGVDGNQLITVAASTTGIFQDLVNTDSIVNADLSNWEIDATGSTTGNFAIRATMIEIT